MYELEIISASNASNDVLMTYQKDGLYVTDSKKEDAALNLTRVTRGEDGQFVAAAGDTIRNAEGEVNRAVSLKRAAAEGKGISATLVMAKLGSDETVAGISASTAPLVLMAKGHDIDIQVSDVEEQYFVYVGSRVVAATYDVTEAVSIADTQMGIVIDNSQNYIWKRGLPSTGKSGGKLSASNAKTSRGQALAAMLSAFGENVDVDTLLEQGQSVSSIMTATLSDRKVLNLTGATLQEVLSLRTGRLPSSRPTTQPMWFSLTRPRATPRRWARAMRRRPSPPPATPSSRSWTRRSRGGRFP